jgi:hypothetical protein
LVKVESLLGKEALPLAVGVELGGAEMTPESPVADVTAVPLGIEKFPAPEVGAKSGVSIPFAPVVKPVTVAPGIVILPTPEAPGPGVGPMTMMPALPSVIVTAILSLTVAFAPPAVSVVAAPVPWTTPLPAPVPLPF